MVAGCVVLYDVEENGDAAFVAFVDEASVVFFGSVCFVESEEEARVVAPTDVAVEFLYWHEFYGVNT